MRACATLLVVLVAAVSNAADRQWQTGTWVDAGTKRSPWVGNPATESGPLNARRTRPAMPLVATYVIETADLRLDLEDVVPVDSRGSFDSRVTIGRTVTFALNKNIAYIRTADGSEYRLRVVKKGPRAKQ